MSVMNSAAAKIILILLSFLISLFLQAQEKSAGLNIEITEKGDPGGGTWYNQPWVWIAGTAVFILLLLALLRGNKVTKE